ncbi:MAG: hypothetical protein OXG53_08425 [Chloroflexi bacterium]|nr:hypothetical protein [Chloroflexota bacterium]
MDIVNPKLLDARLLDEVARAALGNATCGVSTGSDSRIHLLAHNLPEQQRASDVLNNFGTLALTASARSLTAGGADPVISCRDDQIAADEQIGYLVLRADEEIRRGALDVARGACSLTISQPAAAQYTVFFYRLRGNFASGSLDFRVDPA